MYGFSGCRYQRPASGASRLSQICLHVSDSVQRRPALGLDALAYRALGLRARESYCSVKMKVRRT